MTFLPSRNRRQPARARFLLGRLSLALLSLTAAPAPPRWLPTPPW